jgi:hypothetical protein
LPDRRTAGVFLSLLAILQKKGNRSVTLFAYCEMIILQSLLIWSL